MKKLLTVAAFVIPALFTSCGGDKDKTTTETKTEASAPAATGNSAANTVTLVGTDDMLFDKTEITVKADQKVTLTLTNGGKMPKETMAHNFVLLKDGVNEADFALKANMAAPDFIPDDMEDAIIVHTKLLGPGESETIEFTLPKGTYIYLCSFAGHYPKMSGTITAE